MVDLFAELITTPRGQPRLPPVIPDARASFEALPSEDYGLGYAKLQDVFNYLRRGKHLVIPLEWQQLIPSPT